MKALLKRQFTYVVLKIIIVQKNLYSQYLVQNISMIYSDWKHLFQDRFDRYTFSMVWILNEDFTDLKLGATKILSYFLGWINILTIIRIPKLKNHLSQNLKAYLKKDKSLLICGAPTIKAESVGDQWG